MTLKISVLDAMPIALGDDSAAAIRNTVDLARHVERLGFSRYWLTEHHGVPSEAQIAPELMVSTLMVATQTIRIGVGGFLLNHYSPYKVALNARTLFALHGGRFDLGIGRATSGAAADLALKRHRDAAESDDRHEQLPELLRWLGNEEQPDARFQGLTIMPDLQPGPRPWMLGASMKTALYAAENGLPLAFSGFIAPQDAEASLKAYHAHFRPSPHGAGIAEPKSMLAVRVTVADTTEEAERLAMPMRLMFRLRRGEGIFIDRVPSPDEAIRQWGGVMEAEPAPGNGTQWPGYVVGDAPRVAETLNIMAKRTGATELIVQDFTSVHAARLRNYELIAQSCGLDGQRKKTAQA